MLCGMASIDGGAGAAAAQDVATTQDADASIVVTAERAQADRIDVPVAASTISGALLDRLAAPMLRNVAPFVPGLYVEAESPSRTFIAIRGIATDVPDAASEPRIAIYQDGVSQSRRQGALGEAFDIDRIEVVRGPQSTLYGRGALIGAVGIISNRPDPTQVEVAGRIQYGDFANAQVDGMVNLPLGEGVGLRIAGRYRHLRGYVRDLAGGAPYNGGDVGAGRVSLRIAPSDAASLDLIASYQRDRVDAIAYKSGSFLPSDPATGTVIGDLDPFSGASLRGLTVSTLGPLGGRRDLFGTTAIAQVALGDRASIVSTTGYRGYRSRSVTDIDGTALDLLIAGERDRADQLSQELRLAYDPVRAVRLQFGVNYFREDVARTTPVQVDERLLFALVTGAIDRRNPVLSREGAYTNATALATLIRGAAARSGIAASQAQGLAIAGNLRADYTEQYAVRSGTGAAEVFGNASYAPTDRLEVQAGARYAAEDRVVRYTSAVSGRSILAGVLGALRQPPAQGGRLLGALAAPGAAFIPTSAAFPIPSFGLTSQPNGRQDAYGLNDDGFSWRFTSRYAVASGLRVFASYARGRRPRVAAVAGPTLPGASATFQELKPEIVDNYEIGTKYRSADGRLAAELTGYGYAYSNFQTQLLRNQQFVSIDAGRARAYGVEAEARATPVAGVTLIGTYAYNHARFRSGLFAGNRFRLTPDHSASAMAILRLPTALGALEVTPSAAYRSRIFFDETNGRAALLAGAFLPPIDYRPSQAGYAIANLNLGFVPAGQRWRVEAFASNLFDKRYLRDIGAGSLAFGLPTYVAAPPRLIGLALAMGTRENRR